MRRHFTISLCVAFVLMLGGAQWHHAQAQAQRSSQGKTFFVAFMENLSNPDLEVFIAGEPGTRITISMPAQSGATFPWIRTVVLPPDGYYGFFPGNGQVLNTGSGYSTKGIKIEADRDISVFASNRVSVSNDACLILPVESLGKEYVVAAARGTNYSRRSEFAVVGVEPGETIIEIYTPVTASGAGGMIAPSRPSSGPGDPGLGTPHTITLSEGEVYQVQSDVDLSGTIVLAKSLPGQECKKFAVFGGNIFSLVCGPEQVINSRNADLFASGGADHHFEQMKPVPSWGKEYVVIPYQQRERDYVKVYAWQDSTLIYLDDDVEPMHEITRGGEDLGVAVLNKGDFIAFYTFASIPGTSQRKATFIRSNNPIQVAHHCVSKFCNAANPANTGDPYFIMENPVDQFLPEATFNIFEGYSNMAYFLNVSFPLEDMGQVQYKRVQDDSWVTFPLQNCYTVPTPINYNKYGFCYQAGMAPGAYNLRAPTGQVGFISGYAGNFESFGYETGAKMDPIAFDLDLIDPKNGVEIPDDVRGIESDDNTACPGKDMIFIIEDDQERYRYFTWDFGDGTTYTPQENELNDGDTVYHRYENPGLYNVKVSAAIDLSRCNNEVVLFYDVFIKDLVYEGPDIQGPNPVCPNATNRTYSVPVIPTFYSDVVWEVLGDDETEIVWKSDDSRSIRINFGDEGYRGTDKAYILIRGLESTDNPVTDVEGQTCWTRADTLEVEIRKFAPRVDIIGDSVVCRSIVNNALYESVFFDGGLDSVRFEWEVYLEDGTLADDTYYEVLSTTNMNPGDEGNDANLFMENYQINIAWKAPSWGRTMTINSVQFYNPNLGDCIDGAKSEPMEVFVYPDLADATSLDYVSYPPAGQPDDHVLVSYRYNDVNFGGEQRIDDADVRIERRRVEFNATPLEDYSLITPNTPFGAVEDRAIAPTVDRYEYRLVYEDNCPIPEEYIGQDEFRTVFLEGSRAKEDGELSNADGDYASLRWTLLGSWDGEVEQELWRKTDENEWELFKTSDELSGIYELFDEVGPDGVFQYFKIKLRLIENGQTVHTVWSNQLFLDYRKEIYGTPIITPNNDGFNDELIIVNMNSHPVTGPKRIVIFNRWNQHIWSTDDYQQDWMGVTDEGNRVPEGSYFYVVMDRNGGEVHKGAVTIVWN